MIHRYYNNGYYIVLDVNSGAVHVVDELAYEVIGLVDEACQPDEIVAKLKDRWPESDIREVLEDVEENDVILMHDSYRTTVEAALRIVDELQKKGYEFVTADELILE